MLGSPGEAAAEPAGRRRLGAAAAATGAGVVQPLRVALGSAAAGTEAARTAAVATATALLNSLSAEQAAPLAAALAAAASPSLATTFDSSSFNVSAPAVSAWVTVRVPLPSVATAETALGAFNSAVDAGVLTQKLQQRGASFLSGTVTRNMAAQTHLILPPPPRPPPRPPLPPALAAPLAGGGCFYASAAPRPAGCFQLCPAGGGGNGSSSPAPRARRLVDCPPCPEGWAGDGVECYPCASPPRLFLGPAAHAASMWQNIIDPKIPS